MVSGLRRGGGPQRWSRRAGVGVAAGAALLVVWAVRSFRSTFQS